MQIASTPRLAQVFVELADTLVDEFDMLNFLQVLTERCVERLPADAAGLMLTDQRGAMQLMASSHERAREVAVRELRSKSGPSLDCFSTGTAITDVDLAIAHERWPAFAATAVGVGFGAAHAMPMRLRGQVLGALTLFTNGRDQFDKDSFAVGQAMADIATIGLLQERGLFDQQILSEQLQSALHSRVLMEQAKGMLAARAGVTVSAAFTRMRTHARNNGITLTAVATAVVDGSIDERILAGS